MERYLGAFEHSFWIYNQVAPMDFATVAKLQGELSVDRLSTVLGQVQQRHPLLRVRIATDPLGLPKFVETDAQIPLRPIPKPKDYVPPLSRYPQPHIRSVVLSPELTQQAIQCSRAERTTVHGAIGAAFLLALAQQDVNNDVKRSLLRTTFARKSSELLRPFL
jgi:hypothetical protein